MIEVNISNDSIHMTSEAENHKISTSSAAGMARQRGSTAQPMAKEAERTSYYKDKSTSSKVDWNPMGNKIGNHFRMNRFQPLARYENSGEFELAQKLQEFEQYIQDQAASCSRSVANGINEQSTNASENIDNALALQENLDLLHFESNIIDLKTKVYEDLRLVQVGLNQDYTCMLEVFQEFWDARNNALQEAIQKADELVEILEKTKFANASKRNVLLDHLKASFNTGRWVKKCVDVQAVTDIKELLANYLRLNYGEVSKLEKFVNTFLLNPEQFSHSLAPRPTCDPFLVMVTHVVDPSEFYVVRWCDKDIFERVLRTLDKEALSYRIPDDVIPGQMYAVFLSGSNWRRGISRRLCGEIQGCDATEKLYTFYLVDEGNEETVPSSLVRCLPQDLEDIPMMAIQCTLNQIFKQASFDLKATACFKKAVQRSPLSMKIFNQDGGILNVDLAQLPSFEESDYYLSIRDALFLGRLGNEALKTPPIRKFKPKYDLQNLNRTRVEFLRVCVSWAHTPANIYVNVVDEEWPLFIQMQQELQDELANVAVNQAEELWKGQVCAVKCNDRWHRALVEQVSFQGEVTIFLVDTGHRLTMLRGDCYHLPDKFIELPAQSVRCVLDGFKPMRDERKLSTLHRPQWKQRALDLLRCINGQIAVLNVRSVNGCDVGKIVLSREFTLYSILHIDGEEISLNQKLCALNLAATTKKTTVADISRIRMELQTLDAFFENLPSSSESSPNAETQEELCTRELEGFENILQPSSQFEELSKPLDITQELLSHSLVPDIFAKNPQESTSDAVKTKTNVSLETGSSTQLLDANISVISCGAVCKKNKRKHEVKHVELESEPKETIPNLVFVPSGMQRSRKKRSEKDEQEQSRNQKKESVRKQTCKAEENTGSVQYSLPVLKDGTSLVFSWCQSPHAVFFRTEEMRSALNELNLKMEKHYKNSKPCKRQRKFKEGHMCAVYCEELWHRALVLSYDGGRRVFRVALWDRALEREVDAAFVRHFDGQFKEIPKLVLRVALHGVQPLCETWDKKVTLCLTEILMDAEEIKFYNSPDKDSSSQLSGVVTCSYSRKKQSQWPTHVNLNKELILRGYASDQLPTSKFSNWERAIDPNVGDQFRVRVTGFSTAMDVFLQKLTDKEKFVEITHRLAELYDSSSATAVDFEAKPGDLCIAKSNDKNWYRCIVKGIRGHKALVKYVDLGFVNRVNLCNIRLNIALQDVPVLSMRCQLENLKAVGDRPLDRHTHKKIREFLDDKEFGCEVVERDTNIYVVLERENKLLAEELTQMGLLEYINKIPVENGAMSQENAFL